jgi:hypothetical protein
MTKEEQLAKLLADGYSLEDLTWIGPNDPHVMQLFYGAWENANEAARQEMERHKNGQWVIKVAAVERKIREMPGCENYSFKNHQWPEWVRSLFLVR